MRPLQFTVGRGNKLIAESTLCRWITWRAIRFYFSLVNF